MGGFQGFRNPPKRNQLLHAVIEKEAADTKKTTLLSLHDGSKGMKHTRHYLTCYLLSSRHLRPSPMNDCSKSSTATLHGTGIVKVEIKRVRF